MKLSRPVPQSSLIVDGPDGGVVALITSIVVSLLLLVITTSGIALMTSELRQASDYDQSVKAYYAAEAGVEDAIAAIRRAAENNSQVADLMPSSPDCTPLVDRFEPNPTPHQLSDGISYTCQVVTLESDPISGELAAEEAVQFDLSGIGADNPNFRVVVEWNQQVASPSSNSDPQQISGVPTTFPPNDIDPDHPQYWPGRFPALMEATFIEFPDSAFHDSDIDHNTVVLKPAAGGVARVSWRDTTNPPRETLCQTVSEGAYNCRMEFTGFSTSPGSAQNYFLRLVARYSQAHYRVTVVTASGSSITIPRGQILIDVTGNAGDVFRRVVVKIPLSAQPPINQIILADESICKFFRVSRITAAASSNTGCESF